MSADPARRSARTPSPRWLRSLSPDRWPAAIGAYTVVAGIACFWRLGATGMMSMEGMMVEGARNMLASGDWLIPRLYGELYAFKPAFAYWLASLPLRLAEQPSELLVRLPFAGSAFLMGLAVVALVGRLAGPRIGALSAIASVTGVLFLQKARIAEFDVVLAAALGLAIAAACRNLASERPKWAIWLLAYAALAAGFLTKGVPALMVFGPGILGAAFAAGRFRRLLGWRHLTAVAAFLAIVGGYLWAAHASAGPEAFEQPLAELRLRGFGWGVEQEGLRVEDPEARAQVGPLATLALTLAKPVLIVSGFLPWSILLFFVVRRGRRLGGGAVGLLTRSAAGFLVAGALPFLAVPTHEMRYYLPLAVPVGILCGVVAGREIEPDTGRSRRPFLASAAVGATFAVAASLFGFVFLSAPVAATDRMLIGVAGLVGLGLVLSLARRPARDRLALILAVATLCAMIVEYLGIQPRRASKRDLEPQARALARHLPAGEPVWVLGPSDTAGKHSSLFFYLDRPVRAFRVGESSPPAGSYCLLTAEGRDRLGALPGFVFREIGRAEHVWFTYVVGTCSGLGPSPGGPGVG